MPSVLHSVRQEWQGKVYRLFSSQEAAQKDAGLLARGALERFVCVMHASQNGWIIVDKESGREYDSSGVV